MIVRRVLTFVIGVVLPQVAMLGCGKDNDKHKVRISPAEKKESPHLKGIKATDSEKVAHLFGSKLKNAHQILGLVKIESGSSDVDQEKFAKKFVNRNGKIDEERIQLLEEAVNSGTVWVSPICGNKEFESGLRGILLDLEQKRLIERSQEGTGSKEDEVGEPRADGKDDGKASGSEVLTLKNVKLNHPGQMEHDDQKSVKLIASAVVLCGGLDSKLDDEKELEVLKVLSEIFEEVRDIEIFADTLYLVDSEIVIQNVEPKERRTLQLFSNHLDLSGKNILKLGSDGSRNPLLLLGAESSVNRRDGDSELLIKFYGDLPKTKKSSKRGNRGPKKIKDGGELRGMGSEGDGEEVPLDGDLDGV